MRNALHYVLQSVTPLAALLNDPQVIEIMVNGEHGVFVERLGSRPEPVELRLVPLQIAAIVSNLASLAKKEVSVDGEQGAPGGRAASIVSVRLPGFRVEAQMPPVAIDGPYLTIRRHNSRVLPLDQYVREGTLSSEVAEYLRRAVAEHKNIIVSGGTSTGKTTFLNSLLREIDPDERILTIETVAELQISHKNLVRFEADEEQGYGVARLLKSALRSRPDRIIVGEVRGGEAFDLMDAANTGHPGAMASIHANSAVEALDRLENLVVEGRPAMPLPAVRQRVGQTFNVVVQMERVKVGDRFVRRLREIVELSGYDRQAQRYLLSTTFRQEQIR